jgi:hypothetical protein
LNELVDKFDMQKDFPRNSVIGGPDLFKVNKGVDGSEKGTVQPTATL